MSSKLRVSVSSGKRSPSSRLHSQSCFIIFFLSRRNTDPDYSPAAHNPAPDRRRFVWMYRQIFVPLQAEHAGDFVCLLSRKCRAQRSRTKIPVEISSRSSFSGFSRAVPGLSVSVMKRQPILNGVTLWHDSRIKLSIRLGSRIRMNGKSASGVEVSRLFEVRTTLANRPSGRRSAGFFSFNSLVFDNGRLTRF